MPRYPGDHLLVSSWVKKIWLFAGISWVSSITLPTMLEVFHVLSSETVNPYQERWTYALTFGVASYLIGVLLSGWKRSPNGKK